MPSHPPIVFATYGVNPPAAHYVAPGDVLFMRVSAYLATTLKIRYRLLRTDNQVVTAEIVQPVVAGGTQNSFVFQLTEGFMLGAAVIGTDSTVQPGGVYAQLFLGVGSGVAVVPTQQLVGGYVHGTGAIAWPGGSIQPSGSGPGSLVVASTGINVFPNTDVFYSAQDGELAQLVSIAVIVSTTAVAGIRFLRCEIVRAGAVTNGWGRSCSVAIPASTVAEVECSAGDSTNFNVPGLQQFGLGTEVFLRPNNAGVAPTQQESFRMSISGGLAGDTETGLVRIRSWVGIEL